MRLKGREEEDPGNNKVNNGVQPRVQQSWMMVSLYGCEKPQLGTCVLPEGRGMTEDGVRAGGRRGHGRPSLESIPGTGVFPLRIVLGGSHTISFNPPIHPRKSA